MLKDNTNAYWDVTQMTNLYEKGAWTISPNANPTGGSYGVRLYLENVGAPSDNTFQVLKRDDGSTTYADWHAHYATSAIPAEDAAGRIYDSGNGYAQKTQFTSFSQFGVAGGRWVLPISLLNFEAEYDELEGVVDLYWATGSEVNNDYFEIDWFNPATGTYEFIGSQLGAGNSSYTVNYSLLDVKYTAGLNQYRLKQVDYDGQFKYFYANVFVDESSSMQVATSFNLFPNPVRDYLNLEYNSSISEDITYQVVDLLGKEVYNSGSINKEKGFVNAQMYIGDLPVGVYNLMLVSKRQTIVKKFVKQ